MAESPAWMFTKALSHRQKIWGKLIRNLASEGNYMSAGAVLLACPLGFSLEVRYQKVLLRARFDANKDEKDTRKAQLLLADGCRQVWEKRHFKPFRYALDPGGSSYDRERESPDVILDSEQWTLAEREQFPYYFNKREQRKKELLAHWSKIEKAWDDEIAAIQTTVPKDTADQGPTKRATV